MVRYSKGHKEEVRKAILEKASRRLRSDGIGAIGIKTLMGDAGLTHGGFYAHFPSREALISEAGEEALRRTYEFLKRHTTKAPPESRLEAFVAGYLSQQHLEDMSGGCAGAALAPEIAREGEEARRRFTGGLRLIVDYLADLLPEGGSDEQRIGRAYSIFAMMMGAVQIARVAIDTSTSDGILKAARKSSLALANSGWDKEQGV